MSERTCSHCDKPVQGYCGRCGVRVCGAHAALHLVHTEPTVNARLRDELESILASVNAFELNPATQSENDV